ncbi:PREDICTED: 33 kDa ribonucleoprotein, chloroplastic [Prunus mume]|uniref:33 kDa ribonucleoprotein, chloroplastic n=1 Tax=Prunus mume TaxID=102107 RepID=A0ABM0PKU7_PRUMU|nr:PREDICTED: 33 kDa ribonucleoprotein, chloroplastic [Prunus mume]
MLASSLSMASTSTSCSSSLCNKISNFSIPHSPAPIPSHFPPHIKPPKPLKLKAHFPTFSRRSSLTQFRRPLSAFDGFEVEEDSESKEQQNPEAEPIEKEEEQEQRQEEPKVASYNDAGRLYVGNLPYSLTSTQLAEVFGEAGTVVFSEIIYDRVTDRSRGFGFVTMSTLEEAQQAIRMFDGSQVGGRNVKVNFPEVPKGGEREILGPKSIRSGFKVYIDSPHKIYAGNLGWGLSSQGLKDAFEGQPGLLGAKVIYERGSGRSRGFGFVTFETNEAAVAAVAAMNEVEVDGRPLRLNMAAERARTVSVSSSPASEATAQDTDSSEVVSPPASETTTAENTDSSELVSPPASETTTEDAGSSELVSSSVSV